MSKNILFLILILFINHCSFNKNSSFWNPIVVTEDNNQKEELFKKNEIANFELNQDLEINIKSSKFYKNSFRNNLTNNNGKLNYDGKLKKALKYNFKKIPKFDEFEPEIIFDEDNIIFFSDRGTVLKFNNESKLIWKKNYYSKQEKKLKPFLFFGKSENILIIADSISKIYALNINSGELLWSKNNSSSFNSEIKVHNGNIFITDNENILRKFSVNDGSEIWKVKTENSIYKSQKQLSIAIKNNKVFFNNSIGDVMAVDIDTGSLQWIVPTLKDNNYSINFFLKMSSLLVDDNSLYFSTNMNEFYSIDINTGIINWIQDVNSSLRSTIIDNIVFIVSDEGLLNILNSKNGILIRRTDLFSQIKEKKRKKIKPTGFVVGNENIYLTINNGRIFVVNIGNGKTISSFKITNNYISRPFILNQNLFVIKDNGIIKIE